MNPAIHRSIRWRGLSLARSLPGPAEDPLELIAGDVAPRLAVHAESFRCALGGKFFDGGLARDSKPGNITLV